MHLVFGSDLLGGVGLVWLEACEFCNVVWRGGGRAGGRAGGSEGAAATRPQVPDGPRGEGPRTPKPQGQKGTDTQAPR